MTLIWRSKLVQQSSLNLKFGSLLDKIARPYDFGCDSRNRPKYQANIDEQRMLPVSGENLK